MSEPVLTRKQQRKSLSSMKGKKKVLKHLLATPDSVKLSKQKLNEKSVLQLSTILKSLLPEARLPDSKNKKEVTTESSETNNMDANSIKVKRSRLLLGVNAVSKGVKSETAACVLLADDIQPQLLIMHLLLLCKLQKIPFIFMPNFRDLTKKTLGFSCIVLGFKKNFDDFLPAINIINFLWTKSGSAFSDAEQNNEISIVEGTKNTDNIDKKESDKITFPYLYCDSKNKRAFIPEANERENKSSDQSFISVGTVNEFEPFEQVNDEHDEHFKYKSISDDEMSTVDRKKSFHSKKIKLKKRKFQSESKKDFFIDKKFKQCNSIRYSTSKIMKMESNPNRDKKKFKNVRKVFEG